MGSNSSTEIQPDPLIGEVLAMMPQVMRAVASMNVAETSQVGRLEQWTQQLLKQAYFATWNVMSIYFADPQDYDSDVPDSLSSSTTVPVQTVLASVPKERMWLWLELNVLVTLSGRMLLAWQTACCERKPVVDPVLAAVMLDPRRLLQGDNTGLCNALRLTRADEEAVGVLRLRRARNREGAHFLLDRVELPTEFLSRLTRRGTWHGSLMKKALQRSLSHTASCRLSTH